MELRWSHAVVYVRDLEAMLDFYTGVLGFEVTDRGHVGDDDSPEIVFMSQVGSDHHQIAFLTVGRGEGASNSVNHFAFKVGALADVREMIERLEKDGRASALNPMTHGNAWSIYFQDPERNGIEVFCDTPWHVQQPQGKTWDTSLSDTALEDWTRAEFENEPGFGLIADFYKTRTEELAKRRS